MTVQTRMNAARLSIELLCRGLRVDDSCGGEHAAIHRTRAGLGSGIELKIPGRRKAHWINAPVLEPFAWESPLGLVMRGTGLDARHLVVDQRTGEEYPVSIPPDPAWYARETSSGVQMAQIGVLQGTYLGIYVGDVCSFWAGQGRDACQFCTTGENVGSEDEVVRKSVDDVVETALAAKEESGVTFVHLNSGYAGPDTLLGLEPYVRALKERVGCLVGVQTTPAKDFTLYDRMHALGADHLSFCYEFHDPDVLEQYCPGKARAVGLQAYLDAIEHCSKLFGRGSCSGEIIAGIEPLESTLEAIDWITSVGAFPTVCVFRPTLGSVMEKVPPPDPDDMERVYRAVWHGCRKHKVPVGLAPNVEVSLVLTPDDTADLDESPGLADRAWRSALSAARLVSTPVFGGRMKPSPRPAMADLSSRAPRWTPSASPTPRPDESPND